MRFKELYDVYYLRFKQENRKSDETTNWLKWQGLDMCCYEISRIM